MKEYFDFHLLCQKRWQFNKFYLFTLFIGICVSRVTVFKIGKTWTWSSLQYNLKSFLSYTWSVTRWVLLWPLRTSIIKRNLLYFALQLAKVITDWPLWCFYLPFLLYCPFSPLFILVLFLFPLMLLLSCNFRISLSTRAAPESVFRVKIFLKTTSVIFFSPLSPALTPKTFMWPTLLIFFSFSKFLRMLDDQSIPIFIPIGFLFFLLKIKLASK